MLTSLPGKGRRSDVQAVQRDMKVARPIIPDRLYFMVTRHRPKNCEGVHFFTIDQVLRYEPFFVDFGPLNLAALFKFCAMLKHKLKDLRLRDSRIYYYCDKEPQRIGNAAYLISAFMIIEMGRHPAEAYDAVKAFACKAVPFRDASMGICTYRCTVEHCCWAVYRAVQRKFLDFATFNVDEYEYYERVEFGDLNVIVPGKFIAFAGPNATPIDADGYPALTPDHYLSIWKKYGVSSVIRLNKKCYDANIFKRAGFAHHDMYYVDGTTPPKRILRDFIEICEKAEGVIAVHCKAGLGRTGSCVGCYIMKHYRWTAAETIAWLRICRPGSVIGPQQQFLEEQQPIKWREGEQYYKRRGLEYNRMDMPDKAMTGMQPGVAAPPRTPPNSPPRATDPGQKQGEALLRAKARHSPSRTPNRERKSPLGAALHRLSPFKRSGNKKESE